MKLVDVLARVVPHSWLVTPVTPDAKEATQRPSVTFTRGHHAEITEPEAG